MSIESYVCASEGYPHYNNEVWRYCYCGAPSTMLSPGHREGLKKTIFERKINQLIEKYIVENIINPEITVDLDYEKLINKPTVNGIPLVGEFSDYIDNLDQEQLETILEEEGMHG